MPESHCQEIHMLHLLPTSQGNIRQTDLRSCKNTGRVCDGSVPIPAVVGVGKSVSLGRTSHISM